MPRTFSTSPSPASRITNAIIERLEAGTKPWVKPWRGGPVSRPLRVCGTPYRGMNTFWLWMVADMCGYTAKDSEFHRVTCFNGLGKNVAQYCTKGQLVSVQGRIHYTQWEDQDGVKRYGCEILADSVDFLTKGRANGNNEDAPPIDD